jgi:single-stranded-DNA-specific exonuclease
MGAEKQIVRFYFEDRVRRGLSSVISFRHKDEFQQIVLEQGGEEMWQRLLRGQDVNISLDIVYSIEINEYRGNRSVQLQIKDLRPHQSR